MSLFDDLFDRWRKRRLDAALRSGKFWKILIAAIGDRRQIRQYAAELLVRAGYERAGEEVCRACVTLCRKRTSLWREDKPKDVPDVDSFIASLRKRSDVIENQLGYLTIAAIRMGDLMVDRLLKEYKQIADDNSKAWREHYDNVYKKDSKAGLYQAPVDPWVGFAIIGDVARDNTDILHKLAFLYTELHCHDAIRGLAHAERIDEPIWRALSSAASGGDGWAIEAIGKSRDKRALDVLEQAANQYLSDGPAAKLAEALGRCSGERAGAILTQLLEKNDRRGGDDFVKAAADAAADIGYKLAIPLLSKQLSELEKKYGKYPNSIVAKEPEFGFRSSWEPGNSSVGSLTLALGRLAYPEVKETIKRILRKPVDRIEQKEDIFSTDYLLRSTRYPYNAPSTSVWTITYNAWTLYQATRAAASYADPEFVELLVRYLKHENTVVRYGAVTALATYAPGKYRAGFAGCLGDKDALVREAAVRAQGKILARSSDPGAIGAVVELLGDEDDGVRGGAYAAVLAIGPGAVPVLKSQAARPNLRTRVGVLTALAELADVREIPAQAAKQDGLATIFVTPEMVRNGDFMAATQALREASAACATKGEIAQRVHLEFPAPRTGDERDALRQWILRLDAEFPQTPCLLSDQALSAWLRLRLPKRVQDIREGQATGEYGGSASRAALLMELSDRAREFAAQIARGDRRVQERVEKAVVERLVANLQ